MSRDRMSSKLRSFTLTFSDLCYDDYDCKVTVEPGTDANVDPYEVIKVLEATPTVRAAERMRELLNSVNWLALGYAQGLVQRRHDIDEDMKAECAKNGERFRRLTALLADIAAEEGKAE